MTPEAFKVWLAAMKAAGLARSDAECARLLGVTTQSILRYKERGAGLHIALACRALIHRMEPWN